MNTKFMTGALSAAIALTLAACNGGGGGDVAGIGGSGYVSSGSITGFGSVFVNGVKFETSSSSFDVDGAPGTQDELGIGMIVQVSGSINADGATGTATNIKFDDQLQGPVSGLAPLVAGDVTRTFTVLGVTVIIDSNSTTFDISAEDDIPVNTVFNFETITNNNNVEISAFPNANGDLVATRIELKDITFDPASIVEVRGTISGLGNTNFTLKGLRVNAVTAELDGLPNGLVNGQLVEVKGTFDTTSNTITATRVEGEDDSIDDTGEFEVEGLITGYLNDSSFFVNGIKINAGSAGLTREPATLTLANDVKVEVEGAIVNGVLVATKVKARGGEAKIHAVVSSVDNTNDSFEVTVNSQVVTVTVTTATEMENAVTVSDFVKVSGYENDTGGITATKVEVRESVDDVIVQGSLQEFNVDTDIQILGVKFTIDYNVGLGETKFEGTDNKSITQGQFTTLAPVNTLVNVKDKNSEGVQGVADEVDIESP